MLDGGIGMFVLLGWTIAMAQLTCGARLCSVLVVFSPLIGAALVGQPLHIYCLCCISSSSDQDSACHVLILLVWLQVGFLARV